MASVLVVHADLQGDPSDIIRAFKQAQAGGEEFSRSSEQESTRTKSAWDSMKGAAAAFAGAIATYFTARAITDFALDTIKAAGDLQQSVGGVEAVFGASSGQVSAWAQNAAEAVGLSQNSYNQFATVVGSQLANAGFALDEAAVKTNDLITTGADLASMFGGTTSDAVSSLSAAFRGEYDSIEKYGLSIKESDIQARLAAQGMDDLTGEAYRNARAQELLAILSEQTARAQGNFTREADTLQGQQQRLTAEYENQQAALGTQLLPAMTSLVQMGRDILPGAFEVLSNVLRTVITVVTELSGYYQENATWINTLATIIGVVTAAWITYRAVTGTIAAVQLAITAATYGTQGAMLVTGAATSIYTGIMNAQKAAMIVATAAQWAWNVALSANPIGLIIVAVAALVGAIIWFFTQTDVGRAIWQGFIDWLVAAWTAIVDFFTTLWTNIVTVFTTAWNAVVEFLTPTVELIANIIRIYVEVWINIFLVLAAVLVTIWNAIVAAVQWAWNLIVTYVMPVVTTIIDFIVTAFTTLWNIWNGIWSAIFGFVVDVWNNIVTAVLPPAMQIVSFVTSAVNTIWGIWSSIWSSVFSFVGTVWGNIVGAVSNGISTMMGFINGIYGAVMGALSGALGWLYGVGQDMIQGLIDGILGMLGNVLDAIGDVVNGAVDWAKDVLGIASPSKVMMEVGFDTGRGVAEGMKDAGKLVQDATMNIIPNVPDPKDLTASWDAIGNTGTYGTPDWMQGASSGSGASGPTSISLTVKVEGKAVDDGDLDALAELVVQKIRFELDAEVSVP